MDLHGVMEGYHKKPTQEDLYNLTTRCVAVLFFCLRTIGYKLHYFFDSFQCKHRREVLSQTTLFNRPFFYIPIII